VRAVTESLSTSYGVHNKAEVSCLLTSHRFAIDLRTGRRLDGRKRLKRKMDATVITGVPAGSVMGSIKLFKTGVASASLTGNVTTSPIAEDIGLATLQPIGGGVQIVTPLALQSMATATLSTSTGTCSANSCTALFTLAVPAAPPQVGAFNAGDPPTSGYSAAPTPNGILYTVDGEPPLLAGGTAACSQADVLSNSVAVSPGSSFGVGTLQFTNCQ
jgi:hypothetical protein